MIVHQGQLSNLLVDLDTVSGECVAYYGRTVHARCQIAYHPDTRVMVRYARAWIATNRWFT